MNGPENTSKRDSLLHLLGMISDGQSDYITGMEAAGQRQLVGSISLPTDARPDDGTYLALGFTFGDPDPDDPMFRPATLPDGWTKQRTDHSMWSRIVDEHGRERVSIFYKAAYYDRRAFMRTVTVRGYAWDLVSNGGSPIFDDWCAPSEFAAAVAEIRKEHIGYRDMYADKDRAGDPAYAAERVRELDRDIAACDRLTACIPGGAS